MSITPRGIDASYDYIIIGAGSAGCALASRLSREASRRVLLLEAGGPDRHPMIHVPLGFAFLMKDKSVNWCYQTEPEPELNYRKIAWPRGKVVGGSSAINGMVYIRGQREDYAAWAAAGNPGWSFEEILPYFVASEHNTRGADALHGSGGGLWVDEVGPPLECTDLFIQAGVSIGLPWNTDFNGPGQEGIGRYQVNVRNGVRQTAATSFLKPALKRANLELATHALAEKLLLEGERVTGVQYRRKDKVLRVAARRGVILCGGAINSPQLLELSGIGNPDVLGPLGLDTRHALPGVGENLQDHLTVNVQQGLRNVKTFADETTPLGLLRNALRWGIKREGLLIHPACQAGAFLRTAPDVERPNAQIHYTPAAGRLNAHGNLTTVPGTTATICNLRPTSRGSVHVRTPFARLPARDPRQLHGHRGGPARDDRRREAGARDLRLQRVRWLPRRGDQARRELQQRRADPRVHPPRGRIGLSPGRHLRDGPGRGRRGRPPPARARPRGPAHRRCLRHPEHHQRQHQRALRRHRPQGRRDADRGRGVTATHRQARLRRIRIPA